MDEHNALSRERIAAVVAAAMRVTQASQVALSLAADTSGDVDMPTSAAVMTAAKRVTQASQAALSLAADTSDEMGMPTPSTTGRGLVLSPAVQSPPWWVASPPEGSMANATTSGLLHLSQTSPAPLPPGRPPLPRPVEREMRPQSPRLSPRGRPRASGCAAFWTSPNEGGKQTKKVWV